MIKSPSVLRYLSDVCCLGLRLALAGALILHPVTLTLRLDEPMRANASSFTSQPSAFLLQLSDIRNLVVAMLFVLIAVWLMFGIHTRVMALISAALLVAFHFAVSRCPMVLTPETLHVMIAVFFATPLIFLGGGKFSLLRAGWSRLV